MKNSVLEARLELSQAACRELAEHSLALEGERNRIAAVLGVASTANLAEAVQAALSAKDETIRVLREERSVAAEILSASVKSDFLQIIENHDRMVRAKALADIQKSKAP